LALLFGFFGQISINISHLYHAPYLSDFHLKNHLSAEEINPKFSEVEWWRQRHISLYCALQSYLWSSWNGCDLLL